MKFKLGDKSKAICEDCKDIVITTFRYGMLNYKGKKFKVLFGYCDECGLRVSLPHQEVMKIREKEKVTKPKFKPKHDRNK